MLNIEPLKNWFGFTRRERRASFILLLIITIILAVRIFIPEKNIEIQNITDIIQDSKILPDNNILKDQLSVKPFSFDPNTASYGSLIKLGLAEKEAKTLISYRNKGGKFRRPADIKKVYGIEQGKADRLIAYVEVKSDTIIKKQYPSRNKQKPLTDLNSCDTAQLIALPGIGPVLSVRIIKYRKMLGGFATVNQLKEIYGLPAETFDIIKGRVYADSTAVVRIKINSVGYKELSRFPYFEKYEVTAILKYRELKGRFESINDLTDNKLIPIETANRVRPYLSFE